MAEDTKTEPEKADPEKDKAPAEPEIERERLIREAHDFTGYSPHVVAGALAGERKSKFTVTETKKKVAAWLERPVTGTTKAEEV